MRMVKFRFGLLALALVVLLLGACGAPATPAEAPMEEAVEAEEPMSEAKFHQSPSLDALVASGDLPPVEERLPINPLVVVAGVISQVDDLPDLEIGEYGGVMRFGHGNPGWNPDVFIMLNENVLAAPGISVDGIYGNMVEGYTANADNTVFEFQLREGLKWSDGQPVTTADVAFAFDDFWNNEKLSPGYPNKFKSAGDPLGAPMLLEIQDDYTFTVSFEDSYGGFLREMSIKGWQGYTEIFKPAHYLKDFHSDYTDQAVIDKMAQDRNLEDEKALFASIDCRNWDLTRPRCVGFPALWPWVNSTEADSLMEFDRNPYYFKVDAAGNQLPYIDKVVSALTGDTDGVNLKVFADEVDLLREDTALLKLPLYQEAKEKGYIDFRILDNHVDPTSFFLNYTNPDETWRSVVNELDFRRALALAINNAEIVETIYYGFGTVPVLSPGAYDPDQANELLDGMGMDERDSDGWRLAPNGDPFVIPIEFQDAAPDIAPVSELLVEYFNDVGINANAKLLESTLLGSRQNANELFATIIWNVQPMWPNGTWTDYLPYNRWAPTWFTWMNTSGAEGEEPPDPVKKIIELERGRVQAIPGSDEDKALYAEIYQILQDNIFFIAIAEKVGYVLLTDAAMGNVPTAGQAIAGNNSGEQMFYRSSN